MVEVSGQESDKLEPEGKKNRGAVRISDFCMRRHCGEFTAFCCFPVYSSCTQVSFVCLFNRHFGPLTQMLGIN